VAYFFLGNFLWAEDQTGKIGYITQASR
jgi:hypothetical protein